MSSGLSEASIYSVNYDFMPTIPYAAKTMWIQLAFPGSDIIPGTKAKIISLDGNFKPPTEPLTIIDVIGTRVMLETPVELREGQWGFATRYFSSFNTDHRNWTYGNGNPIGKLIYPSSRY